MITAFGHLHQERQNLQSTKIEYDYFPTSDTPKQKIHEVYVNLVPFHQTIKAYGNLTIRFPYISSRG